ncbi:MAG: competence/damage-inducible protein A [Clostridia bacterium]|nr:MAG: competence/damage-inducible protein A [Clostridia bacterium]
MRAEVIFSGTELLLGQILNTNAQVLLQDLAAAGIEVYRQVTVGDNLKRLTEAIREASQRADLVLVGGGLGPTDDDLSREALAGAVGLPLEEDPVAMENATRFFKKRGMAIPPGNYKQGLIPRGGLALENALGTAPGVLLEYGGKIYALLPGPPREFAHVLKERLLPYLRGREGEVSQVLRSRVLRLAGIGESAAEELVRDLLSRKNPTLAPLAQTAEVHLRLTSRAGTEEEAAGLIAELEEELRQRLGKYIYGTDAEQLEDRIGAEMAGRGLTLAVAESCTGGLVSHRITNVPGSSRYFHLGVVAYANEAKIRLLGVDSHVLATCGAVSAEVAGAMATGAREAGAANVGLGVTGIAGPEGGSPEKPVGLVFTALDFAGEVQVRRDFYEGGRETIKERAAQGALLMLWRKLREQ